MDYIEFSPCSKDLRGLMNWQMTFEWHEVSAADRARKVNPWAPHANPIMSGGLFAIGRQWFETLGFYDPGNLRFVSRQCTGWGWWSWTGFA